MIELCSTPALTAPAIVARANGDLRIETLDGVGVVLVKVARHGSAAQALVPELPQVGGLAMDRGGMWLGRSPREWLLLCCGERCDEIQAELESRLAPIGAAIVDVSDATAVVALSGPQARAFLAKGCALDVDALTPGCCAFTRFANLPVGILIEPTGATVRLITDRSRVRHLWRWLQVAAGDDSRNGQ